MTPQKISAKITVFNDRFPLVGPTVWITSVQYFIVQLVVAHAWKTVPYSWANNTISDLGNTVCGPYGGRLICSPYWFVMNGSFIFLGITMMAGAGLLYQEFKETTRSALGFTAMTLAGFGTLLVGLFPENTIAPLHLLGAGLPFVIGNIGLILLGFSLELPKSFKTFTILAGVVSLVALLLLITGNNLGLGVGGMERVVAYPQTVWLILFGLYTSGTRLMERMAARRGKR